jgi:hypothetical protein
LSLQENLFFVHHLKIPTCKKNEPIYLIPFGDIHRDSKLCDLDKWHEFLDWAKVKSQTSKCLFLGMGDYQDLASFSERHALHAALQQCHDDTVIMIDELYRERVKIMYNEISFMRGKLIGLIEGNHHAILSNNTTTTQLLAKKLHCQYLGVSAFIRLSFTGHGGNSAAIDIWAHHGRGASRLTGGSLNAVEQMVMIADADIYLMGHDHRKSVAIRNKLVLTGHNHTRLANKKILMARTGSFLKGYVPGAASYIAHAQLTPTDLGVVKIELTPRRERSTGEIKEDRFYIDIHASL